MDTIIFALLLAGIAVAAAVVILLIRWQRTPLDEVDLPPEDAADLPPPDLATVSAEALIDPVATIPAEAVAPPLATIAPEPEVEAAPPPPSPPPAALDQESEPAGPPDDLTRIKGLGPRAAARLGELGITRYDQLAGLSGMRLAAIAAEMGAFEGRIARDRWIEQAGHLAAGDVAGFEAKFGKLGG